MPGCIPGCQTGLIQTVPRGAMLSRAERSHAVLSLIVPGWGHAGLGHAVLSQAVPIYPTPGQAMPSWVMPG